MMRSEDGRWAGKALVTDDQEDDELIERAELAKRLRRSRRRVCYYHRLLCDNSDFYKITFARDGKPTFKDGKLVKNGRKLLKLKDKPIPGWIVDLNLLHKEPHIPVLRKIRDLFREGKSEADVIQWIKDNDEYEIANNLGGLINEFSHQFEQWKQRKQSA